MKKLLVVFLVLACALLGLPRGGNAETRTISWNAVTTYTDNTPIEPTKTVLYSAYWSTDAALTPASLQTIASSIAQTSRTFDPDALGIPRGQPAYFTVETVLSTGERSALAPAYPWTPPTLISLSISGPSSVNENGSGTYTATATWSDSSTTPVTPTWSENSTFATISAAGVLTAATVTMDQTVTVTANYTSGGVTRTATLPVTIVNVVAPLAISTASPLPAGTVGTAYSQPFAATGGTTPYSWSVSAGSLPAGLSLNSSTGVLSGTPTAAGTSTFTVQVTGGGTATKAFSVTIHPAALFPAAPTNTELSGPVQTSPSKLFRLAWDPVTMYTDGNPIGTVSVTYSAYWTTDESLLAGTLRPLATSIPGTSVTFDPAAAGMVHNQRVYLTVRATLATGQQSTLSGGLTWVAINEGPVAPSNPTIIKR